MQFPTLNLNGSTAVDLFEQLNPAIAALREAERAVQRAMPHGRDYQTSGFESYNVAREEHVGRLQMLYRIRVELEEIAGNVAEQHMLRHKREAV
jgi:hypothetical protein